MVTLLVVLPMRYVQLPSTPRPIAEQYQLAVSPAETLPGGEELQSPCVMVQLSFKYRVSGVSFARAEFKNKEVTKTP